MSPPTALLSPVSDSSIRLVRRIDNTLGDRAALGDGLFIIMEVDASLNVVLGAHRRQRLGAHVAKIPVATQEIGTPRRRRRA